MSGVGGRLKGRRAFVSGAGGAIGRAAAEKFAAEGAAVACADLRAAAAEETARAIVEAGGIAVAVAGDLTDEETCARVLAESAAGLGGLEILFNNAGIVAAGDDGPVETTLAAWNATIAANLTAVFLCCKHGIPHLEAAGGGVIVNNASITAMVGSAFPQIAYTAAKGGVLAMTREIAVMYARRGIRAVAVSPGPTATPLAKAFLKDEAAWRLRRRYIPAGRLAEPAEIANLVAFLASDEASFITGANVPIDGGITAAYVIRDED